MKVAREKRIKQKRGRVFASYSGHEVHLLLPMTSIVSTQEC
jgi:hypothetical protein